MKAKKITSIRESVGKCVKVYLMDEKKYAVGRVLSHHAKVTMCQFRKHKLFAKETLLIEETEHPAGRFDMYRGEGVVEWAIKPKKIYNGIIN